MSVLKGRHQPLSPPPFVCRRPPPPRFIPIPLRESPHTFGPVQNVPHLPTQVFVCLHTQAEKCVCLGILGRQQV